MARLQVRTGRGAALGCAVVMAVLVGLVLLLALAGKLIRDSGLESRLESIRTPLLVAAGVAALGWLALLGTLRWARRPRGPRPTTPSSAVGRERGGRRPRAVPASGSASGWGAGGSATAVAALNRSSWVLSARVLGLMRTGSTAGGRTHFSTVK